MEWLIAVVAVAALGVAAMAAAGGMGQMSRDPVYDTYRQDLPTGGALTAEELKSIRFGVTLRGYAMAQVDDLLDRLALEIAERDALIAELAEGATVSQRRLESTTSARAAEHTDCSHGFRRAQAVLRAAGAAADSGGRRPATSVAGQLGECPARGVSRGGGFGGRGLGGPHRLGGPVSLDSAHDGEGDQ